MKTVLSIAGSDCSGGAGIQADLKTILANGVYGMSVLTALTAQNTTGVYGIMEIESDFVRSQIDTIFDDVVPDAVKIGMVSSVALIKEISTCLKKYQAKNIVVDPVMVSTSGSKLLADDARETLINELMPLATIITPNIPETEVLSGITITSEKDMIEAAEEIAKKYKGAILVKGGHNINDANDLLYIEGKYQWIRGERIDNNNTHGTGCTLSSAIASNLAKGETLENSVIKAKEYISGALKDGMDLGKGSGPLNHGYVLKGNK